MTMIDFTLTDEQISLRELARDFAAKEIRPVAWEYDRDATWPRDLIELAHATGLMNTHVPERSGGPGLSALEGCLIEEELAWGCSGIATTLGADGLAGAGSDVSGMRTRAVRMAIRTSATGPRRSSPRRLRGLVHRLRQDEPGCRPSRHLNVPGAKGRHRDRRQARGQDGAARL